MFSIRFVVILTCCAPTFSIKESRKKPEGSRRCSQWRNGPCLPKHGVCGPGLLERTRHGARCRHLHQTQPCEVPCRRLEDFRYVSDEAALPDMLNVPGTWQSSDTGVSTCSYRKNSWGDCDKLTGTQERVYELVHGDRTFCLPVKVQRKSCFLADAPQSKRKRRCRYQKQQWTECDPVTKQKSRRLNLVHGDPDWCDFTKVLTKQCSVTPVSKSPGHSSFDALGGSKVVESKDCRYDILDVSACHPIRLTQTHRLQLRSGDLNRCLKVKEVQQPCSLQQPQSLKSNSRLIPAHDDPAVVDLSRKNPFHQDNLPTDNCEYFDSSWSPCENGKKTKELVLKAGSPRSCKNSLVRTRSCKKKVCRYKKGRTAGCQPGRNFTVREDKLLPGSDATCAQRKAVVITTCASDDCRYGRGNWSTCDPEAGVRRLIRPLHPSSPSNCPPQQVKQRSCQLKNGRERCFFSAWRDASSCRNGKKARSRYVVAGGQRCEKKRKQKLVDC